MTEQPTTDGSASVKALLIDPSSGAVLWLNDAAAAALADPATPATDVAIEQVIPLAAETGVPQTVQEVAETGETRRLQASLVSTTKGGLAILTSVHRLPDGTVLVLAENVWQPVHRAPATTRSRRERRR